jgi:hypothetical protein
MVTVKSGTVGTYTDTISAGAVTTTPSAGNEAVASATLAVTPAGGGGGGLTWLDLLAAAGVLAAQLRNRAR